MQHLPKLLLLEDNPTVSEAVRLALRPLYAIDAVDSGKAGLYRLDYQAYDIIVLDPSLPDLPGVPFCQLLRERNSPTPILVLTDAPSALATIRLLDAGANDCLAKPFSLGELKARLRALLRPPQPKSAVRSHGKLVVADLILDRDSRQVWREAQPINLRRKEFALLECLMLRPGRAVSREALGEAGWGEGNSPWTNTIDVHIKHLRDKVDRPFSSRLIKTVHGFGYCLETVPTPLTEALTAA